MTVCGLAGDARAGVFGVAPGAGPGLDAITGFEAVAVIFDFLTSAMGPSAGRFFGREAARSSRGAAAKHRSKLGELVLLGVEPTP
jgi:hypothetical protein